MEDKGFEPFNSHPSEKTISGHKLTKDGLKPPKPRQVKGNTDFAPVECGTLLEPLKQPISPSKTTTRPQRAHNRPTTETDTKHDLQTIITAWPDLPKEVKAGILTIVMAVKG